MIKRKVLCPVDLSAASRLALVRARAFAESIGAELTVMHAYGVPHYIQPSLLVWMATGPRPIWEIAEEQARTELDAFLSSIDPEFAKTVRKLIVHDDPAHAIIELARSEGTSVIVMGTHGRTGAERLVLGSVAERVVREAPCPVLTLRAPESSSWSRAGADRQPGAVSWGRPTDFPEEAWKSSTRFWSRPISLRARRPRSNGRVSSPRVSARPSI